MDLRMPDMDGIEATRRIAQADDLAGVRVLVLTTFEDDDNVVLALRAGASGFLGKNVEPAELLHAIRVVAAGDSLLSPSATRALLTRFVSSSLPDLPDEAQLDHLTDREREVLSLVAHGLSNDQIAERLHLSPLTVKTHVSRTMTKLDARDRARRWSSPTRAGWCGRAPLPDVVRASAAGQDTPPELPEDREVLRARVVQEELPDRGEV
jgi:DNA-binding NarL/FixJ family response regulator